jgi:hypothetical protein
MRQLVLIALPLLLTACPMSEGNQGGGDPTADAGVIRDSGSSARPDLGVPSQATRIQELRSGTVAAETQVLVEAVVVTAISPGRGLWVQQGSGPDSGMYLFGSEAADSEGLSVGKEIDLQGVFTIFNDLKQIKFPTILATREGQLPEPLLVSAADLATSASYEGMLVRAETLSIVNANPDGPDDDFGQVELNDGLVLDDDLFSELRNGRVFLRLAGTEFNSITGIAHLSFDKRKLLPRSAEDFDVVGGAPDLTVTVQQIQQGELAENTPVALSGVVVTAVSHVSQEERRGFWVQQGRGQYSGIYVFFGSSQLPDVAPGSIVNVEGTYSEFYNQSQIIRARVEVTGSGEVPEPSIVIPGELAGASDSDNNAEPWEGVLVAIENVAIDQPNPDSDDGEPCPRGAEDCTDFGTVSVNGLRLTTRLWPNMSDGDAFTRARGTSFSRVVGIAEEAFGQHSLAPRSAADLRP